MNLRERRLRRPRDGLTDRPHERVRLEPPQLMAHHSSERRERGRGDGFPHRPVAAGPGRTRQTYARRQLADSPLVDGALAVSPSSLYTHSFHASLTDQLAAPFGQTGVSVLAGSPTDDPGARSVKTGEASTLTITNRPVPELVLYTDASYYEADEVATTGVVIEDADGRVLHTAGVELSGVSDSVAAERYALAHGLAETTHYFGRAHVQAYADCNAVIEQIRLPDRRSGPARRALRDALTEMHVVRFDHINRASNVHADSVATYTADLIRK